MSRARENSDLYRVIRELGLAPSVAAHLLMIRDQAQALTDSIRLFFTANQAALVKAGLLKNQPLGVLADEADSKLLEVACSLIDDLLHTTKGRSNLDGRRGTYNQ